MGTWTYANFKAYLKLRLGNADSWDQYYGTWVNAAYSHLCSLDVVPGTRRKVVIPDLQTSIPATTVSGISYIAKPSDALFVNEVVDTTNKRRLDWIPLAQYAEKTDTATPASYGPPSYWTRRGNNIHLYPTPGGAYAMTIDYRMLPAALSADASTTVLSPEWDGVVLELAVWAARNWIGEPEKADVARKLATEMISGIISLYDNEERARREKLRPGPASFDRGGY